MGFGKFLGFMVSKRGIEANSENVEAILNMPTPQRINNVQKLVGQEAALKHFVSRSTIKCLHFFKILQKARSWNEECNEVFTNLKKDLTIPQLLSQPKCGEVLILYLSIPPQVALSALVGDDGGVQQPIYYTSRAYGSEEARYPCIE